MDKISQIQINILTNEVVGASIYDQLPDVHKKTFVGKEKIQCNFELCFGFIACCKRSLLVSGIFYLDTLKSDQVDRELLF